MVASIYKTFKGTSFEIYTNIHSIVYINTCIGLPLLYYMYKNNII